MEEPANNNPSSYIKEYTMEHLAARQDELRKEYAHILDNPTDYTEQQKDIAEFKMRAQQLFLYDQIPGYVSDQFKMALEAKAKPSPLTFIQLKIRFAKWIMRL